MQLQSKLQFSFHFFVFIRNINQSITVIQKQLHRRMNQKSQSISSLSGQQYPINQNRSKEYICGCGKSYLSYPALFIHIKNKHDGKAPEGIIKPPSKYGKRGRPPKQLKYKISASIEKNIQPISSKIAMINTMKVSKNIREKYSSSDIPIEEIICSLNQIYPTQIVKDEVWREIQVYPIFQSYLNQGKLNSNKIIDQNEYIDHSKIPIGIGLKLFFDHLQHKQLEKHKFTQIFLLFCIYLQYVIDELNKPAEEVIQNVPLDLFSEYLNSFIVDWMPLQVQELQLQQLTLFKKKWLMVMNLNRFFQWMICNRMSSFQVTLKSDFMEYFA